MDYYYFTSGDDSLQHHGIKGMKWGVRRYQTKSGELTRAGRKRYQSETGKIARSDRDSNVTKKVKDDYDSMSDAQFRRKYKASKEMYAKRVAKYGDPYMKAPMARLGKALIEGDKRDAERYNAREKRILDHEGKILDEIDDLNVGDKFKTVSKKDFRQYNRDIKAREADDVRMKLKKASGDVKNISNLDYSLISYGSHKTGTRALMNLMKSFGDQGLSNLIRGKAIDPSRMSKREIGDFLGKTAARTAVNMVINDKLAKSASKNYDNSGRKINHKNGSAALYAAYQYAGSMEPILTTLAKTAIHGKANDIRSRNAAFNKWKGNILTETVKDVPNLIFQADDDSYAIFEAKKR